MTIHDEILHRIQKVFAGQGDELKLRDDVGDDRHFSLLIASDSFNGKTRIERSQMIHEILADLMKTDAIHALTLKLKTLEELSK